MARSCLLVTVDRLGASFLGPYGNSWLETSAINRWAASSRLYEHVVAESLDTQAFARAILRGQHAAWVPSDQGVSLTEQAGERGLTTVGITDDPTLLRGWEDEGFEQLLPLEPPRRATAETIEETSFFQAIMATVAHLDGLSGAAFVWLHLSGFGQAWDAPLEYREELRDDEDPEVWESCEPVAAEFARETDPDELFPRAMAYAAQVRLLDDCLALLLNYVDESPAWREAITILTSSRGYPLGEHRHWGSYRERLYGESLRLPLLIRDPQLGRSTRHREIVQPHLLYHTLGHAWRETTSAPVTESLGFDLLHPPLTLDPQQHRWAISRHQQELSFRTPAWFLRLQEEERELYVKPDDLWEFNDVESRCQTIADDLTEQLHLRLENPAHASPLPRQLVEHRDS